MAARCPRCGRRPSTCGDLPTTVAAMSAETPGLVCAHHHLYSALARGMPAPPATPHGFQRDPRADLVAPRHRPRPRHAAGERPARRRRGAAGRHDRDRRPPREPERDRGQPRRHRRGLRRGRRARRVRVRRHRPPRRRRGASRAGGERALPPGRWARAWSASTPRSRAPTTRSPRPPGWPPTSASASTSTSPKARRTPAPARASRTSRPDDWLLVHCVGLDRDLPGTIAHNPRSNMNNAVGYARPARRPNDIVLGTDGIGADMLEEFRLAYVAHRADDVARRPGHGVVVADERVPLLPRGRRRPRDVDATTTPTRRGTSRSRRACGRPTSSPPTARCSSPAGGRRGSTSTEVRAHAAEQAARLFARL